MSANEQTPNDVVVYGEWGRWKLASELRDDDFRDVAVRETFESRGNRFLYVPADLWDRWLKARKEYEDAMDAMSRAPTVTATQLRRAIIDSRP